MTYTRKRNTQDERDTGSSSIPPKLHLSKIALISRDYRESRVIEGRQVNSLPLSRLAFDKIAGFA